MRRSIWAVLAVLAVASPTFANGYGIGIGYSQFQPFQSVVQVIGIPAYATVGIPVQSVGAYSACGSAYAGGIGAVGACPSIGAGYQSQSLLQQQYSTPGLGLGGAYMPYAGGAGLESFSGQSYGAGFARTRFGVGIGANTAFDSFGLAGYGVGGIRTRFGVGVGVSPGFGFGFGLGIARPFLGPLGVAGRVGLGIGRLAVRGAALGVGVRRRFR